MGTGIFPVLFFILIFYASEKFLYFVGSVKRFGVK